MSLRITSPKTIKVAAASLGFLLMAITGINTVEYQQHAAAVSGSDFSAGRIIDDSVFYNSATMSPDKIQAFLNQEVASCDTNGTQPYSGTTRAAYGTSKGYPPPYTCLKDYHQDEPAMIHSGSDLCPGSITGGSNFSSAQIIYDVSQSCQVNPQVLLVLLEKEQGLVTDDWPWSVQYRSATGYGCPDNNVCDSQYYGFFNQVYQAAQAYRRYTANPSNYNYIVNHNNTIYFHPGPYNNTTQSYYGRFGTSPDIAYCGNSSVLIRSQATANLYIYTPYQPDQAALDNLYGNGDTCSSYGNRNFWRLFNDWFGSSIGPSYQGQVTDQSTSVSLYAGEAKTVWVKIKNTGVMPWGDDVSASGYNPVHLATDGPINHTSPFSASWPMSNRPNLTFSKVYESDGTTLAPDQHVVNNGEIAMYQFTITASPTTTPGTYSEAYSPIREGAPDWWMGPTVWANITVLPTYSAKFSSQSNYPTLKENDKSDAYVSFMNTGNQVWYDDTSAPKGSNPVHLATTNPINTPSVFGSSWISSNRPAVNFSKVYESDGVTLAANQHQVQPGQIGRFDFSLTGMIGTPTGNYKLSVQPIREGAQNWDLGASAWLGITYTGSTRAAAYYSQSDWPTVTRGSTAPISFSFKNTGDVEWRDDTSNIKGVMPIHLATTDPINRISPFKDASWINGNRAAVNLSKVYEADGVTLAANQHEVQPGQIGRFDFTVTIPPSMTPGSYIERFQPILEGAPNGNWSMNGIVYMKITVQ